MAKTVQVKSTLEEAASVKTVWEWVDDYTLVIETSGMNERTWIDRAGRPHSADLRVEERLSSTAPATRNCNAMSP